MSKAKIQLSFQILRQNFEAVSKQYLSYWPSLSNLFCPTLILVCSKLFSLRRENLQDRQYLRNLHCYLINHFDLLCQKGSAISKAKKRFLQWYINKGKEKRLNGDTGLVQAIVVKYLEELSFISFICNDRTGKKLTFRNSSNWQKKKIAKWWTKKNDCCK